MKQKFILTSGEKVLIKGSTLNKNYKIFINSKLLTELKPKTQDQQLGFKGWKLVQTSPAKTEDSFILKTDLGTNFELKFNEKYSAYWQVKFLGFDLFENGVMNTNSLMGPKWFIKAITFYYFFVLFILLLTYFLTKDSTITIFGVILTPLYLVALNIQLKELAKLRSKTKLKR